MVRDTEKGDKLCVLKVILQDGRYKNREYQIVYEIAHPNIVTLLDAFTSSGTNESDNYLNLVMDYHKSVFESLIPIMNK